MFNEDDSGGQMSLYYWESDQKWHAEPEFNQELIITVMKNVAEELEGQNGREVIDALVNPNDELWQAIKERVIYLIAKNEKAIEEHGDSLASAASWLDGFIVGLVVGNR